MTLRQETVELIPRAPRVVGPGRRERLYLERLDSLQERLGGAAEEQRRIERELATSVRLERGCQRLIDRMETSWSEDRERLDQAQAQRSRLILAMGALQRENELLHERLELASAPVERLTAGPDPQASPEVAESRPARARRRPARRSLLARLFSRSS